MNVNARGVIVRRPAEEERQRDPPVRERRARPNRDQDRLHKQRLGDGEARHAHKDAEVRRPAVLRGVVGQHPVQHEQDAVLHPDRDVVHHAPGDELRDDAREHARDQHPEEQAGEDDGERGSAPLWGSEVRGERHEDLRDDGADADEEGEDLEGGETLRDGEPDGEGGRDEG